MAILVLTVQASGQVYMRLGGSMNADAGDAARLPLAGMALTYFLRQHRADRHRHRAVRRIRTRGASGRPTSSRACRATLLGAAAAAVIIAGERGSGYWLTLLLAIAGALSDVEDVPGRTSKARRGRARFWKRRNDAIITMDQQLNIREFNPAAERMFGHTAPRHPGPQRRRCCCRRRSPGAR